MFWRAAQTASSTRQSGVSRRALASAAAAAQLLGAGHIRAIGREHCADRQGERVARVLGRAGQLAGPPRPPAAADSCSRPRRARSRPGSENAVSTLPVPIAHDQAASRLSCSALSRSAQNTSFAVVGMFADLCEEVRRSSRRGGHATARSRRPRRGVPRRTGGSSPAAGSGVSGPCSSATTSDRATRLASSSNTASGSIPSPPQTASAASRVQPPANTASRPSSRCSGSVEQLEGPVDRGAQRLVMRHRAAPATGEHGEAALQPPGQLGRGHRGHPRRRQLDRQRHPVEAATHRGDRRRVLGGHREIGLDRGRAFDEQPHRLRLGDRRQVGVGAGHLERRHRHQLLAVDPEAFAAGRQDHQPRTRPLRGPRPAPPPRRAGARSCRAPAAAACCAGTPPAPRGCSGRPGRSPRTPRRRHRPRPAGSRIGASSHSHAPSPNRGSTSPATCNASRVLPDPARPRSASPAAPRSARPRSCSSSRARPMNELTCKGRFPASASSDRSGGNARGKSGCAIWNTCIGSARSRRRCSPRSMRPAPSGSCDRTRASVASDTRIWPPWAAAMSRAQRFSGGLTYCAVAKRRHCRCAGPCGPSTPLSRAARPPP